MQEALNNVAHHAGVQEAKLRLLYTGMALSVLVEDKGAGFDPEARRAEIEAAGSGAAEANPGEENDSEAKKEDALGHFGMIGMEERARIIGAQIKVLSAPGEGTRVHVRLDRKALGQKENKK